MRGLMDAISLLRPLQWVKNSFVLAGLLFGHAWGDAALLQAALLATFAFCLASSAVYAFNDSADAANDRLHPKKRSRPVARGAITVGAARVLAAGCALAGLLLAWVAGVHVFWLVLLYLGLNVAYSLGLKRIPVVDVFSIATGFMLRLLAGTSAIGIEASSWLLACGFFLTLFLGFAKRKAELDLMEEAAALHRSALSRYPAGFLGGAVMVSAACMVMAYGLYAVSPATAQLHGTTRLVWTLPWVLLGTFRYLLRLYAGEAGADPSLDIYRDPILAACALGWGVSVWLLIAPAG